MIKRILILCFLFLSVFSLGYSQDLGDEIENNSKNIGGFFAGLIAGFTAVITSVFIALIIILPALTVRWLFFR